MCFNSGSAKLQMREKGVFFNPVNYTLVCCVPWISWAARHTYHLYLDMVTALSEYLDLLALSQRHTYVNLMLFVTLYWSILIFEI